MEIEAKLSPPPILEGGKVTSFCVTFSLTNGMAVELSPQFTHCFQMAFLDSVYLILYVSICTYTVFDFIIFVKETVQRDF